jgi:hypothetical protein
MFWSKGDSVFSHFGTDEIPESHPLRWKNARKSLLSNKAISLIFKLLKMVLCSACDGVPLKFKKKNGGPPVY